ncbi:MAG: phospholipase D-like domain-containing protein, partial [Candidatus Hydrogenedentes bacterium]|nr:phospholipase D-like domain-containing protein [Candidatus Hydrogenedentota bacterium]
MTRSLGLVLLIVLVAGAVGLAHYALSGHPVTGFPRQTADVLERGRAFIEKQVMAERAPSARTDDLQTGASGSIQVYFAPCQSFNPFGIDRALVRLIGSAKRSVAAAFYELQLQSIADALIAKHHEGVEVRIVSDSDYAKRDAVQSCIQAGIPVVFDNREPFMHDKFCVVDGRAVWTGSTNATENCMYRNDNNSVLIESDRLAEGYSTEFEEMFTDHLFGKRKRTPYPEVRVDGTRIECYFSPDDAVQTAIVRDIDGAKTGVDVLAFSFTSEPIAKALAGRIRDGVRVRAVFDKTQAGNGHAQDDFLRKHGADVRMDGNEYAMHDKVMI